MASDKSLTPNRENVEFIADLARVAEGIYDPAEVQRKYKLDDASWEALAADDDLFDLIAAERKRRMHNGRAKREKAQKHTVTAPDRLNDIMCNPASSPKAVIESAKTLNVMADGGEQVAAAGDRFQITINLGTDTEVYDKPIKSIRPDTIDGKIIDAEGLPRRISHEHE